MLAAGGDKGPGKRGGSRHQHQQWQPTPHRHRHTQPRESQRTFNQKRTYFKIVCKEKSSLKVLDQGVLFPGFLF
jgi:hypothetical protein